MLKYSSCLQNKICTPCQGDIPPLNSEMALRLLSQLGNGWIINKEGYLYKKFYFKNFIEVSGDSKFYLLASPKITGFFDRDFS